MRMDEKIDLQALWNSFLDGDNKAFAGIYYTFINSLLSYGKKLTKDKELLGDSIQEVFTDLYIKRSKPFVHIDNLKAYLFIAVRNNILKKLIHNHKFEVDSNLENIPDRFQVEYNFEDQWINNEISEETSLRLNLAITNLSPGQKEVIYLRFEEGLNYQEISKVLGITPESARKQLYRALLSLRHVIGNEKIYILLIIFIKKDKESCPH
ncbi:MAG: hypothetical protein C0397_10140 [Odoribacter sp.]|nr:hypothetical protein [Odoribacter sp.]